MNRLRLLCHQRGRRCYVRALGLVFGLLLSLTASLRAQTLQGEVVDDRGRPVAYATVYVRETATGIVADEAGRFISHLERGDYTGEFSALGYEKVVVPFTVTGDAAKDRLRVELREMAYALREVVVRAGAEDPAYAIMRRAIAHAPQHRYMVRSYTADVYIKGTVKTGKLPGIGSVNIDGRNVKLKTFSNKTFLLESHNEVRFTAPRRFDQRVLALSTTVPAELDDDDAAAAALTTNVYDPEIMGCVSPLAPGAFSYYRFRLDGVTHENGHVINKIRVTPRRNDSRLVDGWIYILDHTWSLQQVDLNIRRPGVTVSHRMAFHEVRKDVWMPTAYDTRMHFSVMGIKADGRYYSSVRYRNVVANDAPTTVYIPPLPTAPAARPSLTKRQAKARRKLEELAAKEELTTRDAYRMAQLMQQVSEDERGGQGLERQSRDSMVHITRDSLALLRDTAYWQAVRTQPLQPDETVSYQRRDSFRAVVRSEQVRDSVRRRSWVWWLGTGLVGETVRFSPSVSFGYEGLRGAVPEYNFVDGFWIGQRLMFSYRRPGSRRSLQITPAAYYATARRAFIGQLDATFRYAPLCRGELTFTASDATADYAGEYATNRLIQSLASLLFAENASRLYRRQTVGLTHRIDVANGLRLSAGLHVERRSALANATSYSIFGGRPAPNVPGDPNDPPMPTHTAWIADVRVTYTPRRPYSVRFGEKFYAETQRPTFMLRYRGGLPIGGGEAANFTMLSASVVQTVRVGLFGRFFYGVEGGFFPAARRVYRPDRRHFAAAPLHLSDRPMSATFQLLDPYAQSADDRWLQAHLTYSSDYLLLTQLPVLQSALFNEALHVHALLRPRFNHIEAGYSLGLDDVGRLGVFVGWEDGRYRSVGFTVSLPLLNQNH